MTLLTYPAPERNKGAILEVLRRVLPHSGHVLEIASGTGQHVVHFAAALPAVTWQPSDPELQHRESIAARTRHSGAVNVAAPLDLDVLRRPWPVEVVDAIVCINMIHIAPWPATEALFMESARLLPPGGPLVLYGPYRRDGAHTAPSNAAFDASLRERNPQWGVRDLEAVEALGEALGFEREEIVAMPANNLSLVLRRSRARSSRATAP